MNTMTTPVPVAANPIDFCDWEVVALHENRLAQFRRAITPSLGGSILPVPYPKPIDWQQADYFKKFRNAFGKTDRWSAMRGNPLGPAGQTWCISHLKCPLGVPGDLIWVREAWWEDERDRGSAYQHVGYVATPDWFKQKGTNALERARVYPGTGHREYDLVSAEDSRKNLSASEFWSQKRMS